MIEPEPMITLRECLWWLLGQGVEIVGNTYLTQPYAIASGMYDSPIGNVSQKYPQLLTVKLIYRHLQYNIVCVDIREFDREFIKACNLLRKEIDEPQAKSKAVEEAIGRVGKSGNKPNFRDGY